MQARFQGYFELDAVRGPEDSSSDSSSSDEDDRDLLLLELVFAPKIQPGHRLNLLDLSNLQCEQLFRYAANTNIAK